jgi:hypothetical protein
MHNSLWQQAEEEELEEAKGKSEAGPIMPVLQHLQTVAVEVNVAIKIHVMESFHGDLVLPAVLDLIRIILEGKIMLDWATRKLNLIVLSWSERRCDSPEGDKDGDGGKKGEEDCGLQTAADFPC